MAASMPLFMLGTDPSSRRPKYLPTAACTTAVYERTRKALGGIHLVENALWQNRHFDHLMQELKGPMHSNEHGNSMLAVKCTIRAVREFESSVTAQARPDSIVQRLRRRLHGLCDSADILHVTLLTLGSQRILD